MMGLKSQIQLQRFVAQVCFGDVRRRLLSAAAKGKYDATRRRQRSFESFITYRPQVRPEVTLYNDLMV
jgi:hypothetical protein